MLLGEELSLKFLAVPGVMGHHSQAKTKGTFL